MKKGAVALAAVFLMAACSQVEAGKDYEVLETWTDMNATPYAMRAKVRCKGKEVGGIMVAGPVLTFYYDADNGWCLSSRQCAKNFDEVASKVCRDYVDAYMK